jgi:hypothetical protein
MSYAMNTDHDSFLVDIPILSVPVVLDNGLLKDNALYQTWLHSRLVLIIHAGRLSWHESIVLIAINANTGFLICVLSGCLRRSYTAGLYRILTRIELSQLKQAHLGFELVQVMASLCSHDSLKFLYGNSKQCTTAWYQYPDRRSAGADETEHEHEYEHSSAWPEDSAENQREKPEGIGYHHWSTVNHLN